MNDSYGSADGYKGEVDRSYKRPRVDEIGSHSASGSFADEGYQQPVTISLEDERRLKLIRDHGGAGLEGVAVPPRNPEMYNFEDAASVASVNRKRPFSEQGQNYVLNNDGNGFHNANNNKVDQQGNLTQRLAYSTTDSYYTHNSQQIQPNDSMPGNNWQASYDKEMSFSVAMGNNQIRPPQPYTIENSNYASPEEVTVPGAAFRTVNTNARGGYLTMASGQPPLPASPPPPIPLDPPIQQFTARSSPPNKTFTLFPVPVNSSAMGNSSYPTVAEAHSSSQPYYHHTPLPHSSTAFNTEASSMQYGVDGKAFQMKQISSDMPKVIDASQLFKPPHRASRPDHFVIILRGLPGSGKSYLAKMLRDIEVENGGDTPRIHSMDDYFMTEVEKIEENDASKLSSSVWSTKPVIKKVMEYCYEPEMEEAYRTSMLKAFKRTLEEGIFTFVIGMSCLFFILSPCLRILAIFRYFFLFYC